MKKLGIILLCLFILGVVSNLENSTTTKNNIEVKKELTKQEKIEKQFSLWDGAHIGLDKFIKEKLKDPNSYEHIETTYQEFDNYIVVNMKYRAKNSFGGYVIEGIKVKYSIDGEPLEILDTF